MIPAGALAAASKWTGPAPVHTLSPGGSHGRRCWRVEGSLGAVFVKEYRSAGGAKREAETLKCVRERLPVATPFVLREGERWLVLSACDGEPCQALPAAALATIAKTLGALHAIERQREPSHDAWTCGRALRVRAQSARDALGDDDTFADHLHRCASATCDERLARRALCHRDCGPWNWLQRDGSILALIDFEHARPDWAVFDILHVWETGALSSDRGRGEFARHYGSAPWDAPHWEPALALFVLQTLAWSARHPSDARIGARATRLTERLTSELGLAQPFSTP